MVIPNSVTYIGNEAFQWCTSLSSVEIPNSVTEIGAMAFGYCSSLSLIIVDSANPNYSSSEGVLFNKDFTELIQYPGGKKEYYYTIPYSVTYIGEYTFQGCESLISVEIPNSVIKIGVGAFSDCESLTSVEIPNSVISIGEYAFSECSNLSSVEIPNSITSIGAGAFWGCSSLTSVEIPNSVTSIEYGTFSHCSSLTSVEIPNSVTDIGSEAFFGCRSLTSVYYEAEEPISGYADIFYIYDNIYADYDIIYKNAILYVPEAAVEKCMMIDPWKNFMNIQAYDFSNGIEDATADFNAGAPCEVYNLKGVKVCDKGAGLAPGIYIMRQGNATKKITVK